MKTSEHKMRWYLVLILTVLFTGMFADGKAQQRNVSFQVFYNELSPYGTWVLHPSFGDVWVPDVDFDFTPYLTNGYWADTQYGNTWVSNYDWGWATFHYGRWYYDTFYRWVWVPDNTWAPAWVVWRNGGGYYGWAPMSPGLHCSFSVNLFSGIPNHYWTFVPNQYVWHQSMHNYCAPRSRNTYIVNNTTYVTNYYNSYEVNNNYFTGPSHDEIKRATNGSVKEHHIFDGDRPGRSHMDRDKISMYRPSITKNENDKPDYDKKPYQNNGNHFGNPEKNKDQDYKNSREAWSRNELTDYEKFVKAREGNRESHTKEYSQNNNQKFSNQKYWNENGTKTYEQKTPDRTTHQFNDRSDGSEQRNTFKTYDKVVEKNYERSIPNHSSNGDNNRMKTYDRSSSNHSGNNGGASNMNMPIRSGGSKGNSSAPTLQHSRGSKLTIH